jgi:adhesin transport system outer membrane protein
LADTGTADTEEHPREIDVSITQKLWDFGSTNAAIQSAQLSVEKARVDFVLKRQALVLQGIEAHLNLIRANKILGFAKGSVANIKRQAELEDARVQRGSGFTTDVLQAKTQLAGAEARRNNFAGDLRNAINEYRRFFNKDPGKIKDLKEPRLPFELLPKTLNELIGIMHEGNPGLKSLKIDPNILRQTVLKTRADEFFPSLNASAETKRKEDVGGTIGQSTEQLFKVELTYSLNLGLVERNTLRAAKLDLIASTEGYIQVQSCRRIQASSPIARTRCKPLLTFLSRGFQPPEFSSPVGSANEFADSSSALSAFRSSAFSRLASSRAAFLAAFALSRSIRSNL